MNRRFALTPIAAAALAFGTTLSMAQGPDNMPRSAPPTNIDTPAGAKDRTYGMDMQKERSRSGMSSGTQGQDSRMSRIIGREVVNRQGQTVGRIEDIALDRNGNVYAIVSTGTFLAVGEQLNAVPWRALEPNTRAGQFTLDVDKERLGRAPGFKESEYPNLDDPRWSAENRKYFPSDRTTGMESGQNQRELSPTRRQATPYGTDVDKKRMQEGATNPPTGRTGQTEGLSPTQRKATPYGTDVKKERMEQGETNPPTGTGAKETEGLSPTERKATPYGTDVKPKRMEPGASSGGTQGR